MRIATTPQLLVSTAAAAFGASCPFAPSPFLQCTGAPDCNRFTVHVWSRRYGGAIVDQITPLARTEDRFLIVRILHAFRDFGAPPFSGTALLEAYVALRHRRGARPVARRRQFAGSFFAIASFSERGFASAARIRLITTSSRVACAPRCSHVAAVTRDRPRISGRLVGSYTPTVDHALALGSTARWLDRLVIGRAASPARPLPPLADVPVLC